MKKIIELFNEMIEKGIIEDFAIGGGIATFYYTEAYTTYDLDIFIHWSGISDEKIVDISPVFRYLEDAGGEWIGEFLRIGDIPLQVLVASDFEEEAIKKALEVDYSGLRVKIISPEYLIAMFLQSGREKDKIKIEMLNESEKVDESKLKKVMDKWNIQK
jgi:predicted nucleotidyltransferase